MQIDIREHRDRIRFEHRGRRRDEGVGRDDDLVFGLDAGREERDAQRHGSVDDRDGVTAPVHRREALLELRHFGSVEPSPVAAAQHAQQALLFFRSEHGPRREGPGADRCSSEERK